jgi:hypothetical protein
MRSSVILDSFTNGRLQRKYSKELSKLLQDYFGIKTTISISDCKNAYVIPLYANKRHVMASRSLKSVLEEKEFEYEEWDKTVKNLKLKPGFIDMNNAKVSGVFSTHNHEIGLDVTFFFRDLKFKPRGLVSILLHEVGHAFHMIAMSNRAQVVNVTMEEITRSIYRDDKKRKYRYLVKDLEGVVLDKDQVDDLTNTKERSIFAYKLSKAVMTNIPKLNKYADVSNERLADNFSSRCGYSVELAAGLHSITPNPAVHFASTTSVLISAMMSLGVTVAMLLLAVGLAPVGAIVLLVAVGVYVIGGFNSETADMTYDDSVHRLNSIRVDLVLQLRQYTGLSKAAARVLVESYDTLSALVKNSHSNPSIKNVIANVFSAKGRRANNEITQQRQIERLGSNSLHVESMRLSL